MENFLLYEMFSPTKLKAKLNDLIAWAQNTFLTSHQSIKTLAGVTLTGTGNVTLADLGLSTALRLKGTSSTEITDGATTNPITLEGGASLTAVTGDVVLYSNFEFAWVEDHWEKLGPDASVIYEGDPRLTDARTPLYHTHDVSTVVGLQDDLDELRELIAGIPEDEKEIITVLTAASSAPASAEEDDYYINTSTNALYQYDGSEWNYVAASVSVLYITDDTDTIYRYNGTSFVDVTGEAIDGIIYISDYGDLDTYTTKGLYTVCYARPGLASIYWTMTVVASKKRVMRTYITVLTQTLYNYNGYMRRTKEGSGSWSEWEEFIYASEAELEDVRKVAKKALKTAKAAL